MVKCLTFYFYVFCVSFIIRSVFVDDWEVLQAYSTLTAIIKYRLKYRPTWILAQISVGLLIGVSRLDLGQKVKTGEENFFDLPLITFCWYFFFKRSFTKTKVNAWTIVAGFSGKVHLGPTIEWKCTSTQQAYIYSCNYMGRRDLINYWERVQLLGRKDELIRDRLTKDYQRSFKKIDDRLLKILSNRIT